MRLFIFDNGRVSKKPLAILHLDVNQDGMHTLDLFAPEIKRAKKKSRETIMEVINRAWEAHGLPGELERTTIFGIGDLAWTYVKPIFLPLSFIIPHNKYKHLIKK